jgi:peptidoglycan/xylan/chitin deacetylase (PgdA/CDA1 family)
MAAAVTAYGAVHPRSELFGSFLWRTDSPRKLAITFDDGPNPKITPELLKLLQAHNARATFFVVGRFASQCSGLLRETALRGHAIGNHTATHANLFWRTPGQIRGEIQRCNDAVGSVTGAPPQWFRPPWGFRNPWVVSSAVALGLKTAMWSALPGDWRVKPAAWLIERLAIIEKRTQEAISAAKEPAKNYGEILCLHDGDFRFLNGDRSATIEALRYWLPRWRDLGLEFVTIDQAVNAPAR